MAANEVVGIDIVARLDDFRAELAKIPDIGAKEAKALTSQLSREIKRAERASKTAAEQSKKTAAAFRTQARASAEAASSAKSQGSALLKTAGAMAGALVTVEALKRAYEGVRSAVAEIVADQPAIERFSNSWRTVRDSVMVPLAASVVGVADATAHMLEQMAGTSGFRTFSNNVRMAFYEIAIPAMASFILGGKQVIAVFDAVGRAAGDFAAAFGGVFDAFRASLKGDFSGYTEGIERMRGAVADLGDVLPTLRADLNFAADATGNWADEASRAAREAENGIRAASNAAQAAKFQSKEVVEATKEVVEAEGTKQEAIRRSLEVREKTAAVENSIVGQLATTAISAAENVAGSVINALEETARANIKEAQRRREVEIGLAILRGELQAAGAFGTTLVTYGATPQGFALAAAAAALIGVSSKAAAAAGAAASAERFHSGGVVARDERAAIVQPGEGFLTRQGVNAAGGERALRDLNAGDGGGGGPMVLQVGHKAFDAMASRALSSSSSPLSQRLSAMSGPVGGHNPHRAN